MNYSRISIIAVVFIVIAVAAAGCTGNSQPSPAAPGETKEGTGAAAPSGGSASGPVSASQLLGGVTYDWVEYKITGTSGGEKVSMYFKYNQKTGKCTMRIEGMEDTTGMLSNMDCSSSGSTGSSSDPNAVDSDVKMTKVSTETVTVPAGTFVADKYMISSEGVTAYYWIASGKPLVKMEGGSTEGQSTTELVGWG